MTQMGQMTIKYVVFHTSRFANGLDNEANLYGSESAALVGKPVTLQSLHQPGGR